MYVYVYVQNLECIFTEFGETWSYCAKKADSNADSQVSIIIFLKSFRCCFNSYFQLTCIENSTLSIAVLKQGVFLVGPVQEESFRRVGRQVKV